MRSHRAYSHEVKADAKAKRKILKNKQRKSKNKRQTLKKIFALLLLSLSVNGPKG